MRCRDVPGAFVEGWAPVGRPSARVRRHLSRCAACAEEVRRLATLMEATARLPAAEPGPDYWETFLPRVRQRIAAEAAPDRGVPAAPGPGRSRIRPGRVLAATAAAALLLAAALALSLARRGTPGGSASEVASLAALVEERIRTSGAGAGPVIAEIFPPEEGAAVALAEEPLDLDAALEALDDLAPGPGCGWPDLEAMLEGLDEAEARRLVGELTRS